MTLRSLPRSIPGCGQVSPFTGVVAPPASVLRAGQCFAPHVAGRDKRLANLDAAFAACGITDGTTLSFHHHLRDGDEVLNQVLAVAARVRIRDLRIASSIFPIHASLLDHNDSGS